MLIVARLMRGQEVVASFPFVVESEADFKRGAGDAYAHFRRLHPEVRMFSEDVIVAFGKDD